MTMRNSVKITIIAGLSLVLAGVPQALAGEWYEAMESSGTEQPHSVLKNISTSAVSPAEKAEDVSHVAESVKRVNLEAAQRVASIKLCKLL